MTTKLGLSLDEIMAMVTDIAKDPESGADRFRALKMLASTNTAAAVLPDPMNEGEIVERLARLMRAAGRDLAQVSYQKAFPRVSSKPYIATRFKLDDIPPEVQLRVERIRTLRALYKNYPEVKRPGFPPGYPLKRGLGVISEWCRRVAAKCELDRMQTAANAVEAEGRAREAAIANDHPEPGEKFTPVPAPWQPVVVTDEARELNESELD